MILCLPQQTLSFGGTYFLSNDNVFGVGKEYIISDDKETLVELAIKHDLGYNEITDANPGVDPWYPEKGKSVLIPSCWILPSVESFDLVISGELYTIQTGSFISRKWAQRQFNLLEKKLKSVKPDYLRIEKKRGFYVVRTGRFKDKLIAKKLLRKVKALLPEAFILKISSKKEISITKNRISSSNHLKNFEKSNYLVLNLAELRLYLLKWFDERLSVTAFPVGIGVEGSETPTGSYKIGQKLKDPVWTIPESFRNGYSELPSVVPPGPDNPLGKYALSLSRSQYLIHGTNEPLGIGRRVSHGCIRMYPEDIKRLYSMVEIGDKVIITYQPIKIGIKDNIPYIEVHRDYLNNSNQLQEAIDLLKGRDLLDKINSSILYKAVREKKGIPVKLRQQQ